MSSPFVTASALQAPWPPLQPHPMGQQVDLATDADGSGAAIAGFAAAAPVLPMPSCSKVGVSELLPLFILQTGFCHLV